MLCLDHERAHIVDPMRMIGMWMRQKDRVERRHVKIEELRAQIRPHVDEDGSLAAVRGRPLDKNGAAPPPVLRLFDHRRPIPARREAHPPTSRSRGW